MTDKEIIKALECCKKLTYNGWSANKKICEEECPYKANCYDEEKNINMLSDVFDLINRQQAENKELKTENLMLSQKRFNIFERIEFTDKLKKQAKAEAIKEFWEKLWELDPEIISKVVSFDLDELNNLKKEMVGEDK